jgi:hypothetical protein
MKIYYNHQNDLILHGEGYFILSPSFYVKSGTWDEKIFGSGTWAIPVLSGFATLSRIIDFLKVA